MSDISSLIAKQVVQPVPFDPSHIEEQLANHAERLVDLESEPPQLALVTATATESDEPVVPIVVEKAKKPKQNATQSDLQFLSVKLEAMM